jgi:hypothetical protein
MSTEIGTTGGGQATGGAATPASQTPTGGSPAQTGQQVTPSPVTLKDDDLISYEGAKEPVPFKTLRGLQSQFTKVSQERSKLESAHQQATRQLQERDALIQRLQQAIGGRAESGPDLLAQIRELPYLTGQDAVGVVGQLVQAIQTRDMALKLMAARIGEMGQQVSKLYDTHSSTTFDAKIGKFAKQIDGFPEKLIPRLKELYNAYEGDDLDEVFVEEIAKPWWNELQAEVRGLDKARVQAVRQKPFVPGRGQTPKVSKPLDFAGESADEQADKLWEMFGLGEADDNT